MADNNTPYLELITSEYAQKTKFNAYVKAFLDMCSPTVENFQDFVILFNLENAVGDQLDKLGELVGIGRKLPIENEDISSILSDSQYRKVIKSKIYINHWDGTIQGLSVIMEAIFPNVPYDITDNQNMSYTILVVDPNLSDEDRQLLSNGYILPKPSGVRVNYVIQDAALFGWDSNTTFIKGWDSGIWANT